MPLLVPAFPNSTDGDFYDRFIQLLDTETVHISSGDYERIDLQLIAMVDDARSRLADEGIDVPGPARTRFPGRSDGLTVQDLRWTSPPDVGVLGGQQEPVDDPARRPPERDARGGLVHVQCGGDVFE